MVIESTFNLDTIIMRNIMNINDLRNKQAIFEGRRQDRQSYYRKLERLRNEFVKLFPLSRIAILTFEEYVQGKKINGKLNTNSFCYWVEWKTKELGKIQGARADKFGLYYDKKTQEYKFIKKFENENIALSSLKTKISNLIQSARNESLKDIKSIELSPMFKGKILFLYYPDRFINIFSEEYVDYFIDNLGLSSNDSNIDLIDKRELIFTFKMEDSIMKEWKMWEFSDFLYTQFGRPSKKESTPIELRDYIDFKDNYPNLRDVKPEFINLEIDSAQGLSKKEREKGLSKTKIIDFEKENNKNKRLGEHGELVVMNAERYSLRKMNKADLADRIRQISKENSSAGYDILSFEEDGRNKYIEVKSTNNSPSSQVNFLITINECEKAKELKNYYIYIVFNVKSKNPIIGRLRDPFSFQGKGCTLTPISFRVEISLI
jgi:hypothetical protein